MDILGQGLPIKEGTLHSTGAGCGQYSDTFSGHWVRHSPVCTTCQVDDSCIMRKTGKQINLMFQLEIWYLISNLILRLIQGRYF